MNRLAQLEQLRADIDEAIERERTDQARLDRILARAHSHGVTRAGWNYSLFSLSCLHFGVDPDDVLAGSRTRENVNARHITMWLLKDAGRGYSEIARELGCDHTTVMNAVRRVSSTPALLDAARAVLVAAALDATKVA